ncbi:MAG: hypothetical protein HY816_12050 [Candidatus Wallbacteria bacterium]|nr:hypothetical protein [Candidatus Wallbacteria bacterium]
MVGGRLLTLLLCLWLSPLALGEQVQTALRAGSSADRAASSVRIVPANDPGVLTVLVGSSPDGSPEEKYSAGFQRQFGGQRLHGLYTPDELAEAIVSADRASTPLKGLYFVGHITLVPKKNFPDVRPVKPEDEYLGMLVVGKMNKTHILNYKRQFLDRFDARLRELGLRPDQVFAPGARIAFRVCLVARYMPDFLDELAERVPQTATIEAYTVPFVWSNSTWYPLVSNVFGAFNTRYLFGEQAQGLTCISGRWKPSTDAFTGNASLRETPPDFEGVEAR